MSDHPLYAKAKRLKEEAKALEHRRYKQLETYLDEHRAAIDALCRTVCHDRAAARSRCPIGALKRALKVEVDVYMRRPKLEGGQPTGEDELYRYEYRKINLPYYVIEDPSRKKEWILKALKKGERWAHTLTDDMESLLEMETT